MKWLITTTGETTKRKIEAIARSLDVTLAEADPIPMADKTLVYVAEGPPDLPERAEEVREILAVHPDAPMELV